MNAILKFLYQYNILEIDKKDVKKWLEKEQFDYLKYGIKEGAYDIRLLCLKAYISLNTSDLKNILLLTMNDSVPIVSKFAISILEQKFNDKQVQEIITRKRSYWKKHEHRMQQINNSYDNFQMRQRIYPSEKLNTRFSEQKKMNNIPSPI